MTNKEKILKAMENFYRNLYEQVMNEESDNIRDITNEEIICNIRFTNQRRNNQ